jgi:hypothetical protein
MFDSLVGRLRFLYSKEVDEAFVPRLPSLRAIFDGLVAKSSAGAICRRNRQLCLADWLTFCKLVGVTGQGGASDRDAALCFVWSRMSVTDDRTEMGHLREETLPFEGFLEALARLSALKAFPTDEELKESRSASAASYLADLREQRLACERTLNESVLPSVLPHHLCRPRRHRTAALFTAEVIVMRISRPEAFDLSSGACRAEQ